MKKTILKWMIIFGVALLVMTMFNTLSFANAEWDTTDPAVDPGIMVYKVIDGTPIAGTVFELYKVDDEETSTAIPTDSTVLSTKMTETTDSEGKVWFYTPDNGRYLIVEVSSINTTKKVANFLVDVPTTVVGEDTDTLDYTVVVNPKSESSYGKVLLKNIGRTATTTENLVGSTFKLQRQTSDSTWEDVTDTVLATDNNGEITIDGLTLGSYRFVQQSVNNNYILDNKTAYAFEVTSDATGEMIVSDEEIEVVNEKPTLTKIITNDDILVEDSVKIGDTVDYKVTIELIPETIERLNTFVITDAFPNGLTYNPDSLEITGNLKDVLPIAIWDTTEIPTTNVYDEANDILTITFTDRSVLSSYSNVEITYSATVNEDAPADGTEMKNLATLEYSLIVDKDVDDQTNTETSETITGNVSVVTGGFWIEKRAFSADGEFLEGAEFCIASSESDAKAGNFLTDSNGKVIRIVSNSNGRAEYKGLNLGTYYLVEVKAPTYTEIDAEGNEVTRSYNLLRLPQEIEVTADSYASSTPAKVIVNKKGFELPATGGMGTAVLILLGIVFVTAGHKLMKKDTKKRS